MFCRSLCLVLLLSCQQSYAQIGIEDSLDSIARSLSSMDNARIVKEVGPVRMPSSQNNTAYYQNVIGQLQQQMFVVTNNANQAVAGWRAAEQAKAAMQTKTKQLEDEVDRLRREALEQRKLIDQYKAEQDTIINGNNTYFAIFAKAIADGDEAGVKALLKSIWLKGGGKPGAKDFDVKIISQSTADQP